MRSSSITVAPSETPVSLDELKSHIRYSDNDFDATIQMYLMAAVEFCQGYQWAQYCTATVVDRFDRFCELAGKGLLKNPVQSVTSVQYVDTGGNTQTLTPTTDYVVDIHQKPCRVQPAYATYFPATRGYMNDVTVTYQAGYGHPSDVPEDVKNAILLKAGQLFEGCSSDSADTAIKVLLDKKSYRVMW